MQNKLTGFAAACALFVLAATPALAMAPHKMMTFAQLDTNKNGSISKSEWTGGMKGVDAKMVAAGWMKADANKDGKVSKAEFMAWQKMMMAQMGKMKK